MNAANLAMKYPINWANQAQRNAGLTLTRDDFIRNLAASVNAFAIEVGSRAADGLMSAEEAAGIIQSIPDGYVAVEAGRIAAIAIEEGVQCQRGYSVRQSTGEIGFVGTRWGVCVSPAVMADAARARDLYEACARVGPHGCRDVEQKGAAKRLLVSALSSGELRFSEDTDVALSQKRDWDRYTS